MSLLDGLAPRAKKHIHTCKVRTIAQQLDEADATIYWEAIDNHAWPANDLERQLGTRGIQITQNTIRRHRNRGCSCSNS